MNALEKLRPGDKVVYHCAGFGETWSVVEITRTTKTQITIANGARFTIATGYKVGEADSTFDKSRIYPADTNHLSRVRQWADERRRAYLMSLIRADLHVVRLETLEAIYELMHPEEKEQG